MKQLIFLEYTFLFDAADAWQHLSQFESDLSDFFRMHDLDVGIVKTIGGQAGKRIMILKKVGELERMRTDENQVKDRAMDERRKQPGSKLRDLTKRKLSAPAIKFIKGKK